MDHWWTSSSISTRYPSENSQADMNFLRKFVTGSDHSYELNNTNANGALVSSDGQQRYQKLSGINPGMDSLSALIAPKPYRKHSSPKYQPVSSPSNSVWQIHSENPQRSMSIPPSAERPLSRFEQPLLVKLDDVKSPMPPASSRYFAHEPVYEKTYSRSEASNAGDSVESRLTRIPNAPLQGWFQKELTSPPHVAPVKVERSTSDRMHPDSHPLAPFGLVDTLPSPRRAVRLGSPDYELNHRKTPNHTTKSVKFADDDVLVSKLLDFPEKMLHKSDPTVALGQFPTDIFSTQVHEPVYASVREAHNAAIMTSSMYDNDDSCDGVLFASPAATATTNGATSSRATDSALLHGASVQQPFNKIYESSAMRWAESSCSAAEVPPVVKFYDEILSGPFSEFLALSKRIGGHVDEMAKLVDGACKEQREFILKAVGNPKPDDAKMQQLMTPMADKIASVQSYRESKRTSDLFNHLSAISESIPALAWVQVSPTPGPHIKEMSDAAQFYTNRVLKDWKDKYQHYEVYEKD